jgi:hypothetical protein
LGTIEKSRKTHVRIAVITLDSKAYYKITKILRDHNFSFLSLTPNERIPNFVNLVITTELEKHLALKTRYITLEELSSSKTQRYIILSKLSNLTCKNITIGIDPGHRTGLIVYNEDKEIYASVCRSINQIKKTVKEISEYFEESEIVVKIGKGDKHNSHYIAKTIRSFVNDNIKIEIVDEFGTSNQKTKPNKRSSKDIRAAKIIAFRQGKPYY